MRNVRKVVTVLTVACALVAPASTMAGALETFLREVDVKASADLGSFKADLSVTFGVSGSKVDGLFEVMANPSDVYMVLRVGEVAKRPVDQVVAEHQKSKGQGWGVVAKNLGIQPGSEEFHALKENRLSTHSGGKSSGKQNKGKS